MNLAVNARDAMPRGGKLTIETRNVELDSAYAATHLDAQPGSHVLIAVSDNGHGMDAETAARVFDPFFTTKGPDKGTGMGLATVYGIVKQSGGSIYLYSEPDRGTTFKLSFPRTDAAVTEVADVVIPWAADGDAGGETILLVEDDPGVRTFARRVLIGAGFRVIEAAHAREALELAATEPRIDLLLTDAVLPGMQGAELATHLAAERGTLRVLYVSGFTEDTIVHHGVAVGVEFLPKPYRADALLHHVRTALEPG
jgi:CheY-like chemotaxis protein